MKRLSFFIPSLLPLLLLVTASPTAVDIREGQVGRVISFPPPGPTGLKKIPDADHPFRAPGPNDRRGPCPGLNTMANHGYIPRNGIATPEQMVVGAQEAFSLDQTFSKFQTALAVLSRGNAFTGLVSIGGSSPLVPAVPGKLDGDAPLAGGLSKHGRFEGDISVSRQDAGVGDNADFQDLLFDEFLLYVGKYGADGPEGPMTIVTNETFYHLKRASFARNMAEDPTLSFHPARQFTAFGEAGIALTLFANGTDGLLSVSAAGSIFRNQTFPKNFYRRDRTMGAMDFGFTSRFVMGTDGAFPYGGKDKEGNYVLDEGVNPNQRCASYEDIVRNNVPRTLLNTTGVLKMNVDTLLEAIYDVFGAPCNKTVPDGDVGV